MPHLLAGVALEAVLAKAAVEDPGDGAGDGEEEGHQAVDHTRQAGRDGDLTGAYRDRKKAEGGVYTRSTNGSTQLLPWSVDEECRLKASYRGGLGEDLIGSLPHR